MLVVENATLKFRSDGGRAKDVESFFYRHIAGIQTSDGVLVDRDLVVTMAGGKKKVELYFDKRTDDRDQLRDLISARLTTD